MLSLSSRAALQLRRSPAPRSSTSSAHARVVGGLERTSSVRHFHRALPLLEAESRRQHTRGALTPSEKYAKAKWMDQMAADRERKTRDATPEEKAAFQARREARTSQMQVKRELNKSFREPDMETVWRLHDKLSHRDQWTYNQMIAVAAKGGFVKKAFSIFQKMKKVPLQPSLGTFHWLLQACVNGKEKDGNYLSRAFYVVELMESSKIPLNLHSYNLLLQICANANDIEMAAEVLRKMSASGIAADVSSLSSLLNCTRGEHIEPIQQVWKELCSKFTPDERAWNTYLNVLVDSNFHKEAIAAFKEMIATPVLSEIDPSAPASLPVPSAFTLSLVLNACAESKNIAEARQILLRALTSDDWRPKITFDEVLFQSMLRVAARLKSNIVFAIESRMVESKLPITKSSRELFIMAYGRTNDMKGALRHFEAARTSGELNLRSFTGLLIACRSADDADRALLSFDVLRRVNIRPDEVYIKLLKEIVNKSGRTDLQKRLTEALAEVPAAPPKKPGKADASAKPVSSAEEEDAEFEEDNSEEIVSRARHASRSTPAPPQQRSRIIHGRDATPSQVYDREPFDENATAPVRRIVSSANFVLPAESPSAQRSSFFASERIQRDRNGNNADPL